jgi:hypothetical protein
MISFKSTNTVILAGPQNPRSGTLSTAGTCHCVLYHDGKDSYLTADVPTLSTVLPVSQPSLYEIDVDVIALEEDFGQIRTMGVVTAIDLDAGTITTTTSSNDTSSKGGRVMVQVGDQVGMNADYGTPALGTYDWGYEGFISSSHVGLRVGMPIRIEITLVDTGITKTVVLREMVEGGD